MTYGYAPPCFITGDHYWSGSICSACGERLRCACGRFMDADKMDAHILAGECPSLPVHEFLLFDTGMSEVCETCGEDENTGIHILSNSYSPKTPKSPNSYRPIAPDQ